MTAKPEDFPYRVVSSEVGGGIGKRYTLVLQKSRGDFIALVDHGVAEYVYDLAVALNRAHFVRMDQPDPEYPWPGFKFKGGT